MKAAIPWKFGAIVPIALMFVSCHKDPVVTDASNDALGKKHVEKTSHPVSRVFATGFNNPRGLKFGPDGYLYVAEGGTGGSNTSWGLCDQVIAPVGPYSGSPTGSRISRVNQWGVRTTFADNLPSSQTSAALGSLISGVADVAFIDHTLYAVLAGAGCSHGVPSLPNGVIRVNSNGSWKLIADLSAFQKSHPVKNPEHDDFEPDGTWYGMISVGGSLFAVEPNHGEMVKISFHENEKKWRRGDEDEDERRDGKASIHRVIDISASQGHIVPTVVAFAKGNFYVGNLHTFPIVDGSSNIYKITPGGQISIWATGFTTILGITFDSEGRLYVLENTVGKPGPTPGFGKIIRVNRSGTRETIISGLSLPTGLTIGKDGKLYVSNWGFGPPALGGGQILQIDLNNDKEEN